jgi:hypothetical protein
MQLTFQKFGFPHFFWHLFLRHIARWSVSFGMVTIDELHSLVNSQLTCQHRVLKKPFMSTSLFWFSSTHCNQCTSITSRFVTDDAILVYNSLFYQCISDVLIVMFIRDMCSCAFICLVLLVDGVYIPSLPLYIYIYIRFFFFWWWI